MPKVLKATPAPVPACAPPTPRPANAPPQVQGTLPPSMIRTSPTNPRKTFPEDGLEQLAASFREHGVLQPILVRPMGANGRWTGKGWEHVEYFEVVAGERRLRAARIAGLVGVPVVIRWLTDAEALTIQLIENDQREDVLPSEQAAAYARLVAAGRTLDQVVETTGKSKSFVRSVLALAKLPAWGLAAVDAGTLPRRTAELAACADDVERAVAFAVTGKKPPAKCPNLQAWTASREAKPVTYRVMDEFLRGPKQERPAKQGLTHGDYEALVRRHTEAADHHRQLAKKYTAMLRELDRQDMPMAAAAPVEINGKPTTSTKKVKESP